MSLGPGTRLAAQGVRVAGTLTRPDNGVTDVVVYLVPVAGVPAPVAPVRAEIDQRNLMFVPRVAAVSPGSSVAFPNSDAVMHNVFHPGTKVGGFDLGTYPEAEARSFTFADEGAYVILCHVHPEMAGYVVVIASPFRTVADENGNFGFDAVPPGAYYLRTWHRRLKSLDQPITVGSASNAVFDFTVAYGAPSEPRVMPRPERR